MVYYTVNEYKIQVDDRKEYNSKVHVIIHAHKKRLKETFVILVGSPSLSLLVGFGKTFSVTFDWFLLMSHFIII